MRVLIVDEDPVLLQRLPPLLQQEGHRVYRRSIVGDLPEVILAEGIDLVIFEPALIPFNLSLDLSRTIQRESSAMILMVSYLASAAERTRALRAGADDYLAKPFDLDELLARIDALLRRHPSNLLAQGGSRVQITEEVWLDLAARRLLSCRTQMALTEREFSLLSFLVRHEGTALSRETLMQAAWGAEYEGSTREVDVYVRYLRRKIEPVPSRPRYLLSVWGLGYVYRSLIFSAQEAVGSFQQSSQKRLATNY